MESRTIWQIIKHLFGFHVYSEWRTWRSEHWSANPPPVIYRTCEICGKQYIARYGVDFL